jgi:hypothetical protein
LINSNFGFTPLREVWLGDCYPESWYDHLPNDVADPMRMITEWTKQDVAKLQKFLEDRGIYVRRPVFEKIEDHLDHQDNLKRPPITPRDHYLVLGQTIWSLHSQITRKDPWRHTLEEYRHCGMSVEVPIDQPINCLQPPALVRIGRDLYIDYQTHAANWGFVCEWLVDCAKNYRIHICQTDGHSDGVFCPVAPGVIVTSHYKYDYTKTFPDWEIFHLPDHLHNFTCEKDWWTPDDQINKNPSFSKHILEKAQEWVGDSRETVFEVNMLVLDEKNVVAMKEYEPLTKWLENRGVTTHFFDLRTRAFWDGGWHCASLDINREDSKQDLFSDRSDNGVYWKQD